MAKLISTLSQGVDIMKAVCGEAATRQYCQRNFRKPHITYDLQEVYRAENGRELARFDIPTVKR